MLLFSYGTGTRNIMHPSRFTFFTRFSTSIPSTLILGFLGPQVQHKRFICNYRNFGRRSSLVANSTAATSGKIFIITMEKWFSGSLDLTIGLAIKTTGKTAISVEYDA
jgi:hypothetical protein